ncbi:MAG TPA: glycosyltransferase family 87 protein [Rhizomicrobium sp.]|nr:glycosyltransferase family 87 protein [Rhizomicrobium sp.]
MDSPNNLSWPLLKRYWPIVFFAVLFGIYGWLQVAATGSGHDGVIGPRYNALGADWVIFLAAARAFFTGDLAHIYNQAWITHATNSEFAHWLSGPLPFPLFPYPPLYLLLVLPFAKLPVAWSLALSQSAQFAALAWALRKLAPDKASLFFLVGAFLSPAASTNVLAGSNAVLVAALIVGGLAMLETKPLFAGALLGVMIFKPQFFPLLPLALFAAKENKALLGMTMCAVLLALASVALFGPHLWLDWINVYLHPQQVGGVNGTEWGHRWDDSVSTCVSLLGAPQGLATAAQALSVVIAIAAVWRAFRRPGLAARAMDAPRSYADARNRSPGERSTGPFAYPAQPQRLAILLCATLLASPHVSNYDLLLLALAALLLVRTLPESSRPLALILPLLAWIAPLYNPPRLTPVGQITPLVLMGLIWLLFRRFSQPGGLTAQKPLPIA